MLHFDKLTLTGFKSFVDQTELSIAPGLTGIVGPNGCGKSNLVEALRWVMGETSAKRMRGGAMDDVIFGGAADRPARNLAEVKLDIDNAAEEAPAIFNSFERLEITRKIERDKGSTYRVNGKENRARDVQLLFADAGSGAQSNSLVGQGRISAIIAAKPTDRRVLLEEAAGIAGLYSRRHEAELRLRAAETNLTRLDDVNEALEKQLRSLNRQARQAERYRELSAALRRQEALLFHVEWVLRLKDQEDARARLLAVERLLGERTAEASLSARMTTEHADALKQAREEDARAAAALQRLTIERDNLRAEQGRKTAALKQARQQLEEVTRDRSREQRLTEEAGAADERLTAESEDLSQQQSSSEDARTSAADDAEKTEAISVAADEKLDQLTRENAEILAERQADERNHRQLADRIRSLSGRLSQVDKESGSFRNQLDLFLEDPLPDLEEMQGQLEQLRESLENQATGVETARGQERDAAEALEKVAAQVNALTAERKGVESALDGVAGSGGNSAPPVLNQVMAEPGFEAALGAALGDDLNAPLLDAGSERGWRQLIVSAAQPLPAGSTSLASVVKAPAELESRLAQIIIADDLTAAEALLPQLATGQRIVTRNGDLWRWDGYFVAASHDAEAARTASRMRQRNRLEHILSELAKLTPARDSAAAARDDARDARLAAEVAERDARNSLKQLERDLNDLRRKAAARANEEAGLQGRIDSLASSRRDIAEQLETAEASLEDMSAKLDHDPDAEQARTDALEAAREDARIARDAFSSARAAQQRLTVEAENRERRLRDIAAERLDWQQRRVDASSRWAELEQRFTAISARVEDLAEAPDSLRDALNQLSARLEESEKTRKAAADRLAAAEAKNIDSAKAERDAERQLAQAREDRVRCEAAVEQADMRLRDLIGQVREQLAIGPQKLLELSEFDPEAELPERAAAEREKERLTRERDMLGAVNLRAEQETEELRSELSRYQTEREDVQAAVTTLRDGINELNAEGREKLAKAFQEIKGHFERLFTQLFGGGEARLELTDSEDPLEAGLQVFASPPGKKLQLLSLLSGGEQALTATALLFAAFLVKPAPVCVLDEVDAPLDDENCIRFCTLIRALADECRTRFLIITHNPHTMARVDRLYGVTMAERGISQLMSVNLADAEKMVA